jgi:bacteriocin-like protein
MTDLNSENRESRSEELTIDELDSVSGGRIKIPQNSFVLAHEIAKLQQDQPGFV